MYRLGIAFFVILMVLPVSGAEISSEQARLKATEYIKTPEAPVIYQQPIESFGTSFWVIKLSSESPRFIAIEKTDPEMIPLTEEDILAGLIETYLVAEYLSSEVEKSSFMFNWWQTKLENDYVRYYGPTLSGLQSDINQVNDTTLKGPLTVFNSDLSATVNELNDAKSSLSGIISKVNSFRTTPKYSQIVLLKVDMQAAVKDVKDALDKLIELKPDAESVKKLFTEDPDYEEHYQVYSSISQKLDFLIQTFSETQINSDKGSIDSAYQSIETTMNTSRDVSTVRAQDSISRVYRVNIEKDMADMQPIIDLMSTYPSFFQTSYPRTATEILDKWDEAGSDLSSGYFDDADSKLSEIKSKLATTFGTAKYNAAEIEEKLAQQINTWLATGEEPTSPDYTGIINTLMIIAVVAVVGVVLYTQRFRLGGIFSGGGNEEERY